MTRKSAVVIGSGFGGLALGIRLQSLGFDTTILEKHEQPGGRARVLRRDGFTFDMGPTVITVPHFIEELFAAQRDVPRLAEPDFALLPGSNTIDPASRCAGPATSRYVTLVPIVPFYRIYFDDGSYFDYDGDREHTRQQIALLAPDDLDGYDRFHAAAQAIFERGFLKLGYTHFGSIGSMFGVLPDLLRLGALQSLFGFTSSFFASDKMRQVFSFEPLLIGGNPLNVPAIYAMIHFVEKTWGIHFAMGGTGALVSGLLRKFQDLGGVFRPNAEVAGIMTESRGRMRKPVVRGVTLASGEQLLADLVASNADYAHTYQDMLPARDRLVNGNLRVKLARQSMGLVVIYFGFRAEPDDAVRLRHHNIILGPRYEGLLTDIFQRRVLSEDFSQYLHVPTLTDPALAPPGCHAAYTLIPVPNNASHIDWATEGGRLVDRVLGMLEKRGYIPRLGERLMTRHFITPDTFQTELNSRLGNGFGLEPLLLQSAFFRPHNRSEDITNLYLVGANVQPGGGTPSVMMSAKMTARLIAADFNLSC